MSITRQSVNRKWRHQKVSTQIALSPSPSIRVESAEQPIPLLPVPRSVIPKFLAYAANELPWRASKPETEDIALALRLARDHFARVFPEGSTYDWAAVVDHCKIRILQAILNRYDCDYPSLTHYLARANPSKQDILALFSEATAAIKDIKSSTEP